MTHPCAGHACDHCYTCDVLGICCATVSAADRGSLAADDQAQRERLHAAIVEDATTTANLAELVRLDAAQGRAALPSAISRGLFGPAVSDPLVQNSRKEAIHDIPARSI